MGNTLFHPTGPNVVAVNEIGNCKGDCGKARFVIDTVLNDMRLVGRIPQEEVREKFEAVNEGFAKRAAPWYIWLFMIPLFVAGMITLTSIRGSQVQCTGATSVCSVGTESPDLSTCNKFWCCPHGFDQDSDGWSSKDYIRAECTVLSGNDTLGEGKDTMAALCEEKEELSQCNCKGREGRKKRICGVVKIEGEDGNFDVINGNFAQNMIIGQLLIQLMWIIPVCRFLYGSAMQKRFLKESFKDWKMNYGIETKYYMPQKHSHGMLYLILPESFQTSPHHAVAVPIIVNAEVIPDKQ